MRDMDFLEENDCLGASMQLLLLPMVHIILSQGVRMVLKNHSGVILLRTPLIFILVIFQGLSDFPMEILLFAMEQMEYF
jgi:hypothetical protein